ncbi:hypothetical protein D3C81_1410030 [compost metagenome]
MGQIGFAQHGGQALVLLHEWRRAEQERRGLAQHRRDLRVDAGRARHFGSGFHLCRHLLDISVHEAQQSPRRILRGQADGAVQVVDPRCKVGDQRGMSDFVLQGRVDALTQGGDVHG